MRNLNTICSRAVCPFEKRHGSIVVLSAMILVTVMAFTAFTVDVGYITLTKAHLQNGADAAALASGMELPAALGLGPTLTPTQAVYLAREAGVAVAAANRGGGLDSVYADPQRDLRFGQFNWDPESGTWKKLWGVSPYNMVEVTLRRDQEATPNSAGDHMLPLFFAPVIGHGAAKVTAKSVAAMLPGVGFKIDPTSPQKADVLPITLDIETWEALLAGVGEDGFKYDDSTEQVTAGHDGILEVNLYPTGNTLLPPGNRGTVDFGSNSNSTEDIVRQILNGLNADDLTFYNGELRTDDGPIDVNGDTGISAGMKSALEAIKGKPRAIPLFSKVESPGNNATYTIVKFVGIRIVEVDFSGSNKRVMIQPAPFVDPTVIPGEIPLAADSIFTSVVLIQ